LSAQYIQVTSAPPTHRDSRSKAIAARIPLRFTPLLHYTPILIQRELQFRVIPGEDTRLVLSYLEPIPFAHLTELSLHDMQRLTSVVKTPETVFCILTLNS